MASRMTRRPGVAIATCRTRLQASPKRLIGAGVQVIPPALATTSARRSCGSWGDPTARRSAESIDPAPSVQTANARRHAKDEDACSAAFAAPAKVDAEVGTGEVGPLVG